MKTIKQRLLPGDFARWKKAQDAAEEKSYHELGSTVTEVEKPDGFFIIPEKLKGNQEIGERDFLVFYFDSHEDYELVKEFLENKKSMTKVHPDLITSKLVELVQGALGEEGH